MTTRNDFLWEFRSDIVRAGAPVYVPFYELQNLRGFQSVFGIPKADAEANISRGSVEGGVYSVYTDTLLVDFDDEPQAAEEFHTYLLDLKAAHFKCTSGNRSVHYHVALKPMVGLTVPYSLKSFIASVAPLADQSFYHYNGQFRLMGTKHKKTGKVKKILSTHTGKRLELPLLQPSEMPAKFVELGDGESYRVLERATQLMFCYPGKGNRHMSLWSLAQHAMMTLPLGEGKSEFIYNFLLMINHQWGANGYETKTEKEIRGIVLQIK